MRISLPRMPWLLVAAVLLVPQVLADSRDEIELKTDNALSALQSYAPGSGELIRRARGVLVFPDVVAMGFGSGGQYGEGALLVGGKPVAYYASAAADRHGVLADIPRKSEVILFMTDDALIAFRNTVGWQDGVHGEIDLVRADVNGAVTLEREGHPLLGFSFSDTQLFDSIDFKGTTLNRIAR
jgi:lipid-binding SYLF domain-containing protein